MINVWIYFALNGLFLEQIQTHREEGRGAECRELKIILCITELFLFYVSILIL